MLKQQGMNLDAISLSGHNDDGIFVDDMGEGHLILSQVDELTGEPVSVTVTFDKLQGVVAELMSRYGPKNTDQGTAAA